MSGGDYFQQVAAKWDSMRKRFFSEVLREKAIAKAGVAAGDVAADIGAGTGFITEGLLARGASVVAVDRSEAMLAEMREKFGGRPGIEFLPGSAEALPLEDESVDHAFANMYLHHVESPPAAVREMARILKPGGRLVVTDLFAHDHEFLRTEHHDRWMGFEREEIRGWLEKAGLGRVTVEDAEESCCACSGCGSGDARIDIFLASGIK